MADYNDGIDICPGYLHYLTMVKPRMNEVKGYETVLISPLNYALPPSKFGVGEKKGLIVQGVGGWGGWKEFILYI